MKTDSTAAFDQYRKACQVLDQVRAEAARMVVGHQHLIDRLLIALICRGHVLIEGLPGLAKTLTVTTLAKTMRASFQRIQFTPDLLPADLVGALVYHPHSGQFSVKKGPVFHNIVLADEINRAPPKVQSALLEAMQERQVTIGETTFPLDDPFMVLATQNPIEQEGTYPLPEAQLDRFLLKVQALYPSLEEEKLILRRMAFSSPPPQVLPVIAAADIAHLQQLSDQVYLDEKIQDYILSVVRATRHPEQYGLPLGPLILYGASPRAAVGLCMAAKAHALLHGRSYVTPDDVKTIGMDVLRHRVIVSYQAEAEEQTAEDLIGQIFAGLRVP